MNEELNIKKTKGDIMARNKKQAERLKELTEGYGEEIKELSLKEKRYKKLKEAYSRGEKLKPASLLELGLYMAELKKAKESAGQEEQE
ncbi:hypothetical protein LN736_06270 [Clostridium sp. WLY-B-L2]|uniref:Uncharacterized protein n=1 Tax=Clostridium aromativorans TaxID=2836848 RepID=A0ABS8N3U8_9CLOT|nr:hypothetical protein [Clostridium aromativorans]MCC9294462.1 hypothetical protein [Clostridium aromativorans]